MKKINLKELMVIGIGIFAFCLAVSGFIFWKFNMTSDYLTATATFFAAFVALYLYSDWRIQYKISKLDILYIKFDKTTESILDKLHEIDYLLTSQNIQGDSVKEKLYKLIREWNSLSREFQIFNELLTEYKIIIYSFSTRSKILKKYLQYIEDIQNEISPKILNMERVLREEKGDSNSTDKINFMKVKFIENGYRGAGSRLSNFVFEAKTNILHEILKGQ